MQNTLTSLGETLRIILDGLPFHLMYEEPNRLSAVEDLNPLLRRLLGGRKQCYPSLPGTECDVVFTHSNETVWMETKLLQTHNGGNRDTWRFEDRNVSFRKHLGILASEHASGVRDVRHRLPTLDGLGVAHRIAFLAVVYDSPRHEFRKHVQEFANVGNLSDWTSSVLIEQADPRPHAQSERAMISVLLWERSTSQLGT